MIAKLINQRSGREYSLLDGVISIGRNKDNDIRLPSRTLSRFHAELRFENGVWLLEDQGSTYGTFVNGEKVENAVALSDGDEIRFAITPNLPEGEYVFIFRQESPDTEPELRQRVERLIVARRKIDAGQMTFERKNGFLVVRLTGVFRRREVNVLIEQINQEVAERPRTVVLDLKKVRSMNSYALAVLVDLGLKQREQGQALRVFGAVGSVGKLLAMPGETNPIEIYEQEKEALVSR